MSVGRVGGILVLFVLMFGTNALGADLYTLTVTTTSGPPQTVTASGSNFLKLVQNVASTRGDFAALAGQDVTASLAVATNQRVLTISRNAAGTQATIAIPSIGFSHTINAANTPALKEAVKQYLKKNVDDAMGRLNQKLQEISKVGAIDGNPHAGTAFIGDDAFYRWGLPAALPGSGNGWWASGHGGTFRADGVSGNYANVAVGGDIPMGERAAVSIGFTSQYETIGNARSYTLAVLDVGIPYTLYKSPLHDGFIWQATPMGYGMVTISPGTLSGGGIYGGGAASSLTYVKGPFAFTLGDQIGYFGGLNLGLQGYDYGNQHLDQWILKNGVKLTYSANQHLFFDGGVTYTNFLKTAGVPDYFTPTAGIGWRLTPAASIRVAYRGDYAHGYSSTGGEITFNVAY